MSALRSKHGVRRLLWRCLSKSVTDILAGCGINLRVVPIAERGRYRKSGWCLRPSGEGMIPTKEEYYNVSDSLTVQCAAGYYPSRENITCINGPTGHQWDPSPRCIAQCRRPAGEGVIPAEKEFYIKHEYLQVRCQDGYRLSSYWWTECTNPRTDEWDPSPQCIEQCKKPSINNLENVTKFKEYYNLNRKITITCKSGYYPSSPRIQCKYNGDRDDWTPTAVCIGVNVTALEVTSTSVRLRIVCSPDQCHNPGTTYISSCIYLRGVNKGCKTVEDVTFSGLVPVTQYEILVTRVSGGSSLRLQTLTITTGESVPGAPEIVQTPSMEDGTIIWRLDSDKGNITGFELNILAWRDYNHSFSINVTQRFPPNVTQYNINLQHGTNYTLHLRGFTSVGGREYRKITLETPIGDPPDPKFEKKDFTVHLHPVPDVHGPISYYEIIVSSELGSNTSGCLKVTLAHYNSTPTHYTAALLPAHNLTGSVTLGDNQRYGSFLNAPLTPELKYAAYVRVTSKWKQEKSSCAFLGFFTAKDHVVSAGYMIARSVLALLLLLVLLVLAVLWRTGYYQFLFSQVIEKYL